MIFRTQSLAVILFFALFISACKKAEVISNTPNIKFVSISPNPAIKYQDEIKITIEYTDGDGDLGENTPDVKNVFCTDSRNNVTYQFRAPQLSPTGASIIIKGNLVFNLAPQGFIDDNKTSEKTTYSIYIKDRAGNSSNIITTSELTINKQ